VYELYLVASPLDPTSPLVGAHSQGPYRGNPTVSLPLEKGPGEQLKDGTLLFLTVKWR
jgi:hypothetical protein